MINCKKWLPNLGEDLFLENTLILGRKLENMRPISSEDLFCFMILVFVQESQTIFCPIHKVLEYHNLGKTSLLIKIF